MAADFTIKQNDTNRPISGQLQFNGSAVDISGASVKFIMTNYKNGNVKVDASATIVDAANGEVKYDFGSGDTDTAGSFKGEFEVTYSGGKIETFPYNDYIEIEIEPDLG